MKDTQHICHACSNQLDLPSGPVGRSETCPKCGFDVHACKNCRYYDQSVYNECREPTAERVVDKEKRNFCDQFEFRSGGTGGVDPKLAALKKLEELFKK